MLLFEISLVVLLQRLFKVGAVLVGVVVALAGVAVQSCVEVYSLRNWKCLYLHLQ